jgi:hypothetical protein
MGGSYPRIFVEPGQVFSRLTVIKELKGDERPGDQRMLLCKCQCGKEVQADLYNIVRGLRQSCGCVRREQLAFRNQVLMGIPQDQRKEYWASVRTSIRLNPERAKELLSEAAQRGHRPQVKTRKRSSKKKASHE